MALTSSGALSLNEIHVEAGGDTGTTAGLNDTDIRDLISKSSGATMAFNEWYGAASVIPTGLIAGGEGAAKTNTIQKITISTTGNSTDFGDLSSARGNYGNGAGSSTRALYFGGQAAGGNVDTIEFSVFATAGDVTDFGNLTVTSGFNTALSSSTRAVSALSEIPGTARSDVLEFVTMASAGNSTDFGNLLAGRTASSASFSSPTRGIFAGGWDLTAPNGYEVIEFITIASAGNSTDFGDLSYAGLYQGGASNSTRGLIAGGYNSGFTKQNIVEFITIASAGDATDFGDLSAVSAPGPACATSSTRMVAALGETVTMDYFTISSAGNSTDFGDSLAAVGLSASCSNVHGGLA